MKPVALAAIRTPRALTSDFSKLHVWLVVDSTKNVSWHTLKFTEFSVIQFVDSTRDIHIWIGGHRSFRITSLTFSEFSFPIPSKSTIPSTFCPTITSGNMAR